MKELDQKSIVCIAIASIFFMELLILGGWGIAVPISVIIYYSLVLFQNRKLKVKNNILLIPIVMISLCFVFFDNTLLKTLNVIFLYILIILDTSERFEINKCEFLSFKWIVQVIPIGIITPLKNILTPIELIKGDVKEKYKNFFNILYKVLIGFAIGLPIVLIATILLMRSDVAFKSVMELMNNNISFNFIDIIERVVVFIIIFFPLYGYFYGIKNKNENVYNEESKIRATFDFIIVTTAASFLCIVYAIYCLSQFTYFISAFKGILPSDYTFAEYARQGFFECIPLAIINLIFIIVLRVFVKVDSSNKKKAITKGFIYYIIIFTLFLVISALSKMVLYINAYGITLMRVYVAWILILGCIIFVLIGIKEYNEKLKLFKNMFIAFTIMFLFLNYLNIDYRIAKYDSDLYISGKADTIDAFEELSNSALEPLIEISKFDSKKTAKLIKMYENRVDQKAKWQDWNLVIYNSNKIFNHK